MNILGSITIRLTEIKSTIIYDGAFNFCDPTAHDLHHVRGESNRGRESASSIARQICDQLSMVFYNNTYIVNKWCLTPLFEMSKKYQPS